jgi:ketosteroid isomerase-like protein
MGRREIGRQSKPVDVARELYARFERRDMMGFCDLFSIDADIEAPFAAPGNLNKCTGREELRAFMKTYNDRYHVEKVPHIVIHETVNPELVVVEWTAHGTTVATGKPYQMRYIVVIAVRDGEIIEFRDYFSPIEAAKGGHTRPDILALFPDEEQ